MKIIKKSSECDITPSPIFINRNKFMENIQIKRILQLNQQQIALIRSSSILVYEPSTSSIVRTIQLPFEIEQVVYNPKSDCFYAYEQVQSQVIRFSNEADPSIENLYNISQNKGNIKFQWSPCILLFQNSENLILVRKLYGESLVIIFKTLPIFQKMWQFTCNESSLSKIDEQEYLVNYSERNNKFLVKFELYNCTLELKNNYKIDNIQRNICKGVKLYQKVVETDKKARKVWLKMVIGVNFKVRGSGILLVNVMEGVDDQYNHLATVRNADAEIHKMLSASSITRSVQVMQFQYFEQERQTKLFLTNYAWNNQQSDLIVTDSTQVDSELQDSVFSEQQLQLITFSNKYTKPHDDSYTDMSQKLLMNTFRFISKKIAYLHLMQHISNYQSKQFIGAVCELL